MNGSSSAAVCSAQSALVGLKLAEDFCQIEWDAAIEDDLRQIVRLAVREDLDRQYDWTTVSLIGSEGRGAADVVAREEGVIAGMRAAPVLLNEMDAAIDWTSQIADGDRVGAGTIVARLAGSARDMLTCERPLLNLLGRLSGIATLTSEYVAQVAGTHAGIYDTRKTTPGWRRLEKYAVRCGGGHNHRTGLFDAILIKDNHLALAGQQGLAPAEAVRRARAFVEQMDAQYLDRQMPLEVEVDTLEQLAEVLAAGPDIILLDNMAQNDLARAVEMRDATAPNIALEASGGVSLASVRAIAMTGVDRISAGALTHSARWLDVALDWRV